MTTPSILRKNPRTGPKKSVQFPDKLTEERKYEKDTHETHKELITVVCQIPAGKKEKNYLFFSDEVPCKNNTSQIFSENFIKSTLSRVKPYDFIKTLVRFSLSSVLGKTHRFEDEGYFTVLYHLTPRRQLRILSKSVTSPGISVVLSMKNGEYILDAVDEKIKNRGTNVILDFEKEPFSTEQTSEIISRIKELKFVQTAVVSLEIWEDDDLVFNELLNEVVSDEEIKITVTINDGQVYSISFYNTGDGVSRHEFINYSLVPYMTESASLKDSSMEVSEKEAIVKDLTSVTDGDRFYLVVGEFVYFSCLTDTPAIIHLRAYTNELLFKKAVKLLDNGINIISSLVKLSQFNPASTIIVQEIISDALGRNELLSPLATRLDDNSNVGLTHVTIPEHVTFAPTISQEKKLGVLGVTTNNIGQRLITANVMKPTNIGLPKILLVPNTAANLKHDQTTLNGRTLQDQVQYLMTEKDVQGASIFFQVVNKTFPNRKRKNRYLRVIYWYLAKAETAELVLGNWFQFEVATEFVAYSKEVEDFLYQSYLELARYSQYGRLFLPFRPVLDLKKAEQVLKRIHSAGMYHPFERYIQFGLVYQQLTAKISRNLYELTFTHLQDSFAYQPVFTSYYLNTFQVLPELPLLTSDDTTHVFTAKQAMTALADGDEYDPTKIEKKEGNTSKLFSNLIQRNHQSPSEILQLLFDLAGDVIELDIQPGRVSFYTNIVKPNQYSIFLPFLPHSLFFLYSTPVKVELIDDYSLVVMVEPKENDIEYRLTTGTPVQKSEKGLQITLYPASTDNFAVEARKYHGVSEELYINNQRVGFDVPLVYQDINNNKIYYNWEGNFPSYIFNKKRPVERFTSDLPLQERLVLSTGFIFETNGRYPQPDLLKEALYNAVARTLVMADTNCLIVELKDWFLSQKEFQLFLRKSPNKYAKVLHQNSSS